jgi:hypothetical protein
MECYGQNLATDFLIVFIIELDLKLTVLRGILKFHKDELINSQVTSIVITRLEKPVSWVA